MSKKPSAGVRPPFIRESQITSRFGISRGTQYRLRQRGLLPKGIRLGARTVIFSEPEILEALAALAEKQS